jgi:hypothetical protein
MTATRIRPIRMRVFFWNKEPFQVFLAQIKKIADTYDVGADIRSGVWKTGFACSA